MKRSMGMTLVVALVLGLAGVALAFGPRGAMMGGMGPQMMGPGWQGGAMGPGRMGGGGAGCPGLASPGAGAFSRGLPPRGEWRRMKA